MKVLLIGGGGREHAIAKKIAESSKLSKFYAIPGNPGIAKLAEIPPVAMDNAKIIEFAKDREISLIICGPEAPLVDGLADMAKEAGIPIFGPSTKGAMLEGSKIFSKQFMYKYNIPTSDYKAFDDYEEAKRFIENKHTYPAVIKADGLAAGKGVKIAADREEALATLKEYMVDGVLDGAGKKLIIEDFMVGEEMSAFYITDGNRFLPLIAAKDYKRAYDGDKGENTGGMGCYAPHTALSEELKEEIEANIIANVKRGFKEEGIDYRGVLFVGLMLTDEGAKVVEFNCRFGDPETQVILPLVDSDLLELFSATAKGTIDDKTIKWKNDYAACVVLASGGYPGSYKKGVEITFDTIDPFEFGHAGTKYDGDKLVTNGGRVLNAVALGASKSTALKAAYNLAEKVKFEGSFYRTDIGS